MEISKNDLEYLSHARIEDARILFEAGQYSGAYYIAGYAIELALKACIAKKFRADFLPDKNFVQKVYTHMLGNLIGLAGLTEDLRSALEANNNFHLNWVTVNKWTEESRYNLWDQNDAKALFNAISDPRHGVLQWLKKYY